MSEERIKKIASSLAATPNPPSIMSAPREKKKGTYIFLIIAGLAISIAVNIILAVVLVSKNERVHQLETEIDDNKATIVELKNKLNSLEKL